MYKQIWQFKKDFQSGYLKTHTILPQGRVVGSSIIIDPRKCYANKLVINYTHISSTRLQLKWWVYGAAIADNIINDLLINDILLKNIINCLLGRDTNANSNGHQLINQRWSLGKSLLTNSAASENYISSKLWIRHRSLLAVSENNIRGYLWRRDTELNRSYSF